MTLSDIKAECERDTARMDSSHEKMDKLSEEGGSDHGSAVQNAPGPAIPYAAQPGGPRAAIVLIAIVAVLAVVFLAVLVFIVMLPDNSPIGVYKDYVDAANDQDARRMFDQTVTRFTDNYEESLDTRAALAFYLDPEIEILSVGVTYQADMNIAQELVAEIAVDDVESRLSVQVDDFCIVDYTITLTYTEIDQGDTFDGEVLCVQVNGHWYLAVPGYY